MDSIFLDVVVVGITARCVVLGYKKGFVTTVVTLFSYILSLILAFVLSNIFSKIIISAIEPNVLDYVHSKIQQIMASNTNLTAISFVNALPEFLKGLFPNDVVATIDSTMANSTEQAATMVTETFFAPAIQLLIQSALLFVLFFVLLGILNFIARRLTFINKIPLVGSTNAILGTVTGFIQALIIVIIIVNVVSLIISVTNNSWVILNSDTINSTLIFKNIYKIILNIFNFV